MDGMQPAVDRILRALETHERIIVFGDYDVDGTNSAAMLYMYFTKIGLETMYHIPDRVKEGYGLSSTGILRGKEYGATLLITIDCGITAIDQVEFARAHGIEVIVCDHHEPGETLPNAFAILDPLKANCSYPFKNLCGAGVGFKLIQGVAKRLGDEESVHEYVDFATLATTADIVPLFGENRILTKIGLERINATPRIGMQALLDSSGTPLGKISTGQIVFVLAPRINAVGRMGDASRAVELLTCSEPDLAIRLARILEEENRARRLVDEETFLKAQELADIALGAGPEAALVLHQDKWHPGVIGIVASRMVEKYYRPAIMMTTVDGVAKGSARSIAGFDIHKALKSVEDKLIQFGGHKYAAGLTVELDRLDEFRQAFNLVVEQTMPDEIKKPEIKIDAQITLGELTPRFIRILGEFAPFGPGNMRPVFVVRNVEVVGTPRIVGKNHLRFKVRQDKNVFDAIGFGLGELIDHVRPNGRGIDLVFSVDEHEWRPAGATTAEAFPQLKIKDIKHYSESV